MKKTPSRKAPPRNSRPSGAATPLKKSASTGASEKARKGEPLAAKTSAERSPKQENL